MSELRPVEFGAVVGRAFREWERRRTLFDVPASAFYHPRPGIDLSTTVWSQPAANPVGPASGPHTQLAPNMATAYLAGARVFEWKTVHASHRTAPARPFLDVAGQARFLDTALAKDGKLILDFNEARNPPCAFTPYATCPLAPPENRLDVRVTAGEKKYAGGHG